MRENAFQIEVKGYEICYQLNPFLLYVFYFQVEDDEYYHLFIFIVFRLSCVVKVVT